MIRGQYQDTRWIEGKSTDYNVPSFGVVRIVGARLEDPGRTVLTVNRPTTNGDYPCAINSHKPISADDYGIVAVEGTTYALYDTADGTPTNGEIWGPKKSSYKLSKGKPGFVIYGAANASRGIVLVNFDSASTGGNHVATTAVIIPKRVGTDPGGPVYVQPKKLEANADTGHLEFVDCGGLIQIYSWVKTDSSDPADEDGGILWIFIEQDPHGIWWFTGQDCPPAGDI